LYFWFVHFWDVFLPLKHPFDRKPEILLFFFFLPLEQPVTEREQANRFFLFVFLVVFSLLKQPVIE
jgi:hypothetical protein